MIERQPEMMRMARQVLCVDLDGTLLRTDVLHEQLIQFIKANPINFFRAASWLLMGKKHLKARLAEHVNLNVTTLPYRQSVLDLIARHKKHGAQVALVTATHETVAKRVASYLGVFNEVFGSTLEVNLKGETKCDFLNTRYGEGAYVYVGDSRADIPIWRSAGHAIVVDPSYLLKRQVTRLEKTIEIVESTTPFATTYLKAMRPHQWVKNSLIFAPMLLAHRYLDASAVAISLKAFAAFSLCASAVYIFNDILDVEADRATKHKASRPFASGSVPIHHGIFMGVMFLVLAAAISLSINLATFGLVFFYIAMNTLYSFRFKQEPILDILLLAGMYTLRIFVGSTATGIPISEWLLGFSTFLFLSLGALKRYTELSKVVKKDGVPISKQLHGRGYLVSDLSLVHQVGVSSAVVSILVLALYIQDAGRSHIYSKPSVLWVICPALFYWVTRAWLKAVRGEMNHDPVVFALTDKGSYWVGLIAILAVVFAL